MKITIKNTRHLRRPLPYLADILRQRYLKIQCQYGDGCVPWINTEYDDDDGYAIERNRDDEYGSLSYWDDVWYGDPFAIGQHELEHYEYYHPHTVQSLNAPMVESPFRGRDSDLIEWDDVVELANKLGLKYGVATEPFNLEWSLTCRDLVRPEMELQPSWISAVRDRLSREFEMVESRDTVATYDAPPRYSLLPPNY